ncbi:hypothetical protein OAK07_00930 [Marine Group III euryarchaeote]|nr:hypothetical protein [Marine Group III euryarchaeote]
MIEKKDKMDNSSSEFLVTETWANTDKAKKLLGYQPKVGVEDGVSKFIDWYKAYY